MRMQSFHLSTQGASHIKKNKECQDFSESYFDEKCAIAIVCDGHGGDDYVRSAKGSEFGCAAAKSCIMDFVNNVDKEELKRHSKLLIHNLEASIISAWNDAIYDHYKNNPFTEKEIAVLSERAKRKYLQEKRIESAYGTTMIAVVSTEDYWFGIHIGDGKCVAVNPEGKFVQPIPWDDRCFLNATTSICDSDALSRFRSFYSEKLPVAVFVGSDGVDDCFSSEQQLNNLYRTVLYSFATSDFDAAVADLSDYLPRLSAKGSGDDVSVAAILDLDKIGQIEAVKEFDKEKEKARVEENARIAAQKAEEERKRVEAERAEQFNRKQVKDIPTIEHCKKCGAKLPSGTKFCGECGTRVQPAPSAPDPVYLSGVGIQDDIIPEDSPADSNTETLICSESNTDQGNIPMTDAITESTSVGLTEKLQNIESEEQTQALQNLEDEKAECGVEDDAEDQLNTDDCEIPVEGSEGNKPESGTEQV